MIIHVHSLHFLSLSCSPKVEAHSDKLEELRPQLNKLWKDLTSCSLPTYLHILVDLLERVHSFIENCGVSLIAGCVHLNLHSC